MELNPHSLYMPSWPGPFYMCLTKFMVFTMLSMKSEFNCVVTPYVLVNIYRLMSSVPPSLGPNSGITDNENGSTTLSRNVGKYLPIGTT